MGAEERPTTDRVAAALAARAPHFSFFQLVRLLERTGEGVAIGGQGPAVREVVRFRAHPGLAFPPGDISALEAVGPRPGRAPHAVLTVTFMGLYGPASPLPAPYTEAVIAADVDDPTRRDFLDFFHQRPLGFLYRGWRKYRYYVNFAPGAEDDFSQRVFAFFGAHFRGLRSVVHLDWVRLLSCGGLLAQAGASAEVVGRVVSHYFGGLAAAVEPFVRCRFAIAEDQLARIGRVNSTLGRDLFVGRSAADLSGRFRLRLGPLDWRRLNDFLPVGADHRPLVELVRFALADPLDFELALMIRREDVRPLTLDRTGDCRLGWTSWIGRPDDALQCVRLQVQ